MDHAWIGRVVDDRYEIQGVLGRGGMGTVFRARHRLTAMQVALKVLHEVAIDDAAAVQRFIDEARAPAVIGHPAIVEITDANRAPTGELYLAMQLLFGRSLRAALGQLDGDELRRIGLELLDALAAAHRRRFVHRDLKPENVFLASGGALKLLDFGIAKVLGREGRTVRGQMLGTLEYMAPEQLLDPSSVDARADLWAVGIILYEAIAGVRPFGGATFDDKYHALATDLPMPIDHVVAVPPAVVAFFARALDRDRDRRFGSAAEMAAALRELPLSTRTAGAPSAGAPTLATGDRWDAGSTRRADGTAADAFASTARADVQAKPRARWPWLALGGIAVIGLAVTIGVVAGRETAAPDEQRVVTPTPSPDAAPPAKPSTPCRRACEKLATCKLAFDLDDCEAICKHERFQISCVTPDATCVAISSCLWQSPLMSCPAKLVPHGTHGCSTHNPCWDKCASDDACFCKCAAALRPEAGLILLRNVMCPRELEFVDEKLRTAKAVEHCSVVALACADDH